MRILIFLSILFASPSFAADWTVAPAPSDDPGMTAAAVRNDDGHALFLWGREFDDRYQLFAELHLGGGERFGPRMPIIRVDGGNPLDTDVVRQEGEALGALWGHVTRDTAFWLAWTSIQKSILPSDELADWFTGKELEISYTAEDGTEKVTRFPLAGSADAVRGATGLSTP